VIRRRSRAQGMLEYALVLPVFLMLTIGVIDFSRAVWTYNTIAFISRDTARYGVVPTRAKSAIESYGVTRCAAMGFKCYTPPLPSPLPDNSAAIVVNRGTCGSPTQPVVVTVTYAFQPASLMIANLWGGGILPLEATTQMFVEPSTSPSGGCPS
jgi:TadE-like protein